MIVSSVRTQEDVSLCNCTLAFIAEENEILNSCTGIQIYQQFSPRDLCVESRTGLSEIKHINLIYCPQTEIEMILKGQRRCCILVAGH